MGNILAILCLVVIGIGYLGYISDKEKKIKAWFLSNDKIIPLDVLMCFSNTEFVQRFKRYFGSCSQNFLLEYADGKYVEINSLSSERHLLKQIEQKQDFMIDKRYNPDDEYVVKDSIKKVMFNIWLDYGYKDNYKKLFWNEMVRLYDSGDVATSTFNEINRRFYKYKQMS